MRATFASSGLKKNLWPEMLKSCCMMLNQVPRKGEEESPWRKMHGKELPEGFLRPVGTPTIVLNQRRIKGRKFHQKGEEGVLVGFNPALLSYRVLMPAGTIVNSKHIKFLKKPETVGPTSNDDAFEDLKITPIANP
ncbi:hypothetical protein VP01_1095g7 [Puccinia sorghi]|uniref:Uncharacterized protein n=1 Tax=Puccinia sorghi TaxID=27349 RepID=A0A0L6VUF9_9BASI|nr:hypothetical protein VP01_1095g7 [Puccinia sorghi]